MPWSHPSSGPLLACGLMLGLLAGCATSHADAGGTHTSPRDATARRAAGAQVRRAVAVLVPIGGSGVQGTLSFDAAGTGVRVHGRITGLTPGEHGFHVHEWGDLSDAAKGESAGSHFDPHGMPHGHPGDEKRHAGDLGNVLADASGVATVDLFDRLLRLEGPDSIVGRSVVVHVGPDKFTQPVGDAGGRVAVGVIGVAKPAAE